MRYEKHFKRLFIALSIITVLMLVATIYTQQKTIEIIMEDTK